MSQNFDVFISGAGIVGMTLALSLARLSLTVAVVGKTTGISAARDIRAYALSKKSHDLLSSLRVWPDELSTTPILRMNVFGDQAGHVEFDAATEHLDALNWIVDVPTLEEKLATAIEFQPNITRFYNHPDAHDPIKAKLMVICEGKASTSAQALGLNWSPKHYNQNALAARIKSPHPHLQTAYQWFSGNEILGLLPLGGNHGDEWALVWSLPPDMANHYQQMPENEFCEALCDMTRGFLDKATLTSSRALWPLRHVMADKWQGKMANGTAWVLAGDSAHSVHPLAGQGLNLGLGDAAKLAHILKNRPLWRPIHDPRLLRDYERSRKAEFALLGNSSDALQRIFSAKNPLIGQIRNWGMSGFNQASGIKRWVVKQAAGI